MGVQGKSVEDFHRDDHPRHTKQAHRGPRNPTLSEPQSCPSEHEQARGGHGGRQGCAHVSGQGRIGHHHGHEQPLTEPPLALDRQARDDVVRGSFGGGRSSKGRMDVAHGGVGCICLLFEVFQWLRVLLNVQGEAGKVQTASTLERALAKEVVLLRPFHGLVLKSGTSSLGTH